MAKIVASTTDEERAEHRARQDLDYPLRELAANLLRVVRGAGKPYALSRQMSDVLDGFATYREAVGHWPPSEAITQILEITRTNTVDAWIASFPREIDEASVKRWLEDGTYDHECAKDEIVRAALQIAASRLLGQRTQEVTAEHDLSEATRGLERVREQRGKAR